MTGARLGALLLAGSAWVATLAGIVRSEITDRHESPDIRAIVDSARLSHVHASATWAVSVGGVRVGSLASTVSGGQHEEQLAYLIEGRLSAPQDATLRGVVLAGWDRRPQRVVLEARMAGRRHRIEGMLRPDPATTGAVFELRYVPPSGEPPRDATWVLPEAPLLAPGPLPVPELPDAEMTSSTSTRGAAPDPETGIPMDWSVTSGPVETLEIAGRSRAVRRHELRFGAVTATALVEPTGFPVRAELPGGVVIELVAESR